MHFISAFLASCQSQRELRSLALIVILAGLGSALGTNQSWGITEEQRARAAQLAQEVSVAGQLYAAGSVGQSAAKISQVQQELIDLLKTNDPTLRTLLKPIYMRLLRAHGLLELEGAQLEALPAWDEITLPTDVAASTIDRGAKFNGPNPAAPLATIVTSPDSATTPAKHAAPPTPLVAGTTDSAAVSFAKTIAPILTTNCQGCHIGSRQASGGLRMDTFAQLLRGGDSGNVIATNKADESLLVQKIRGESGERMPAGGRPALSTEQIETITQWINAGAPFDGPSVDLDIQTVMAQAWAASADHQVLFERRQQSARARWAKVLPNEQPATAVGDELLVLGNVPPARLRAVYADFETAIALTKKLFKAPANQPLLKGGLSVFALKSRYDYSEFGRMTESRELPREWLGHWHADPLDVYGVLTADASAAEPRPADKQAAAVALQIVVGAYLGSFAQVPTWFAEGVARNMVKTTYRRGDDRINAWQQAYPAALQKLDNAKTLSTGRLDEEAAGLVGMGLTSFMMERNNRRRFDQLLDMLRQGQTFEAACTATFASPEMVVKTWLGQ